MDPRKQPLASLIPVLPGTAAGPAWSRPEMELFSPATLNPPHRPVRSGKKNKFKLAFWLLHVLQPNQTFYLEAPQSESFSSNLLIWSHM
jgi:hypothetical protein